MSWPRAVQDLASTLLDCVTKEQRPVCAIEGSNPRALHYAIHPKTNYRRQLVVLVFGIITVRPEGRYNHIDG
jgi:hypothetical protein